MSKSQSISNISDTTLRDAIKKEYENVAIYPNKGYHFHTGLEAANRIGYDKMNLQMLLLATVCLTLPLIKKEH